VDSEEVDRIFREKQDKYFRVLRAVTLAFAVAGIVGAHGGFPGWLRAGCVFATLCGCVSVVSGRETLAQLTKRITRLEGQPQILVLGPIGVAYFISVASGVWLAGFELKPFLPELVFGMLLLFGTLYAGSGAAATFAPDEPWRGRD